MDFKPFPHTLWPLVDESRPSHSSLAEGGRPRQSAASPAISKLQLADQDENRELLRMLAGLFGLVTLIFMALFALIRF